LQTFLRPGPAGRSAIVLKFCQRFFKIRVAVKKIGQITVVLKPEGDGGIG
jgi:hypothetical protein